VTSEVEKAFELKDKLGNVVLAGEVNAVKVEGFDVGNSPTELVEYAKHVDIHGKDLILRTTSGAKVIDYASKLKFNIIVGTLLNAKATAEYIIKHANAWNKVKLICAGYRSSEFALDDFIGAACIIKEMVNLDNTIRLSDGAYAAYKLLESIEREGTSLRDILYMSKSARRLLELGYEADIEFCSKVNVYNVIAKHVGNNVFIQAYNE